jgi:hypothetical protein
MSSRRWAWVVALAAIGAAVYVGQVLATNPAGFVGTTLAKGTFDNFKSHVKVPGAWDEKIRTKGVSDLYVQQNTWDPTTCGACVPTTGWHTHPGPSLIVVTQGTLTVYDGDDRQCTPHVYTANTPDNSFVDPGGGHVHVIRNESGAVAKTIAVQLVPAGAVRREDTPDPGNCSF